MYRMQMRMAQETMHSSKSRGDIFLTLAKGQRVSLAIVIIINCIGIIFLVPGNCHSQRIDFNAAVSPTKSSIDNSQVAIKHQNLFPRNNFISPSTSASGLASASESSSSSSSSLADATSASVSASASNDQNQQSSNKFESTINKDNGNDFELDNDESEYLVGVGIADITGPAADINLMGYAKPNQDAGGIHLRQFSRSIVIEDKHGHRIVYSSLDNGMISQLMRTRIIDRLKQQFGDQMYNESNVMLSATHSHSCPGGFFQYMLYNIPSAGFIQQTLDALVDGVVRSVDRAHQSMAATQIYYNKGELLGASINRSPISYANNPIEERARYKFNTDKEMFVLRFVDKSTQMPVAMLNWFAVHGTSMNNTNHLISSDNKGYAALLMEHEFNPAGTLPGQGKFVAIFAQANEGDISPNTRGARCIDSGLPCDLITSTCGNPPRNEKCIASGPGKDMFESTKIIAHKQYQKARELFLDTQNQKLINGPVRFVHEHIDMTQQEVPLYDSVLNLAAKKQQQQQMQSDQAESNINEEREDHHHHVSARQLSLQQQAELSALAANSMDQQQQQQASSMPTIQVNASYKTCPAGLGYSFAAGTTDGPGAFDFQQGDTASSRYWNMVRDFLKKPSVQQQQCHQPKPILLSTGEMDFPYMWHPRVIPTQILMIGQVAIVGLPGEFTTMSGRRIRDNVKAALGGQTKVQTWPKAANSNLINKQQTTTTNSGNSVCGADSANSGSGCVMNEHHIDLIGDETSVNDQFKRSINNQQVEVVLSGLSNIYSSYVTTLEEYQIQRYEGASTLYGPHTLQAYINQFVKLAGKLVAGSSFVPDPVDPIQPPDLSKSLFTLKAGVIFDGAPSGKRFGSLLQDVDTAKVYECQDQVSVSFVSGNPRNDLRQEQSFLYVDKLDPISKSWVPIASDASWETKFIWERTNTLFGESKATIQWDIPHDCHSGVYRIRHYGAHKNLLQTISQYSGESSPFKVMNNSIDNGHQQVNSTARIQAELEQLIQLADQVNANQKAADLQEQIDRLEDLNTHAKGTDQSSARASALTAPFRWISSLFRRRD